LFLNRGVFPFADGTQSSGLARFTRPFVGWGTHFLDYDNDGLLDLMIVNGHVIEGVEASQSFVKYREQPLLLRNSGNSVFQDVSSKAGPAFTRGYLARGLAIGDWDNNGAPDAIFTCIGEMPVLLRNNLENGNSWIGVGLTGTKSNRDAIGAKVEISISNKRLVRWVAGGTSYLSSHDKRLLFGLGSLPASTNKVDVEVHWPSGTTQIARSLAVNRHHQIVEEVRS
jgi:hypothetical protein